MMVYYISAKGGANLRTNPSCKYGRIEKKLGYLETVDVLTDWSATNRAGGEVTTYLPVKDGDNILYAVADFLAPFKSHADMAKLATEYVYQRISDVEAVHKDASGVVSVATLEKKKRISCNRSASMVLQLAGCLPVGKIIAHTDADGKSGKSKTAVSKAISGTGNLIEGTYTMKRVDCVFSKLPAELKKKGIVYVQDSNMCVSVGNGKIYSCNDTNKKYGKNGVNPLKSGGYPFTTKILYVIVPKG